MFKYDFTEDENNEKPALATKASLAMLAARTVMVQSRS